MATKPFPRLNALNKLTWDDCFALDRAGIQRDFIKAIVEKATSEGDNQTRKLAALLFAMTNADQSRAESTALIKGYAGFKGQQYTKIDESQPVLGSSELGRVFWSPKGTSLKLWCLTVFDLLGACMSDAAWIPASDQSQKARTKDNYFAQLASLYSYWCFRLIDSKKPERRPAMTSIALLDDIIILGCSIPSVPDKDTAKETIRQSRITDLAGRGRQNGSDKQILDLTRVKALGQDYGNCAETWLFCLLALQDSDSIKNVHGVAVRIPTVDVNAYNAQSERTSKRYAGLCKNCTRLITQMGLWGPSGSVTVTNFNPIQWNVTKD